MGQRKKTELVTVQIFFALGFGLGGAIIVSLGVFLYYELMGIHLDLYGEIVYALIGGYAGMQSGIGLAGFRDLKKRGRQKNFLRFFLQSVLGLLCSLVGVFVLVVPIGNRTSHALINFLAIGLPLIGSILGFNFGLYPKNDEESSGITDTR